MKSPKRASRAQHRGTRADHSIELSPVLTVALEHVAAGIGSSSCHLKRLIAERLVHLENGIPALTPLGRRHLDRSKQSAKQRASPIDLFSSVLTGYVQRFQEDFATKPKRLETRGRPGRVPSRPEGGPRCRDRTALRKRANSNGSP